MLLLFWRGLPALVAAETATATATAIPAGLQVSASFAAPTAVATAQALPIRSPSARFDAEAATASGSAVAGALTTRVDLSGQTALASATAPGAALSAGAVVGAPTATATVRAEIASMGAISYLTAQTATAVAAAPAPEIGIYATLVALAASGSATAIVAVLLAGQTFNAQLAFAIAQAFPVQYVIGGVGSILIPAPQLSGEGFIPLTGAGDIVIPPPILQGTAFFAHNLGAGGVVIPPPILSGDGTHTIHGNGAIVIPPPILSGEGATPVEGAGNITIGAPRLSGAGTIDYRGTGGVVILPPLLSGSGQLGYTGTGAIVIPPPILTGLAPSPTLPPPPPPVPSDIHIIECFDINGVLLGRIQPIRRAKFTMVENDIGDFEIELPWIYDDLINILQTRNRIEYTIKGIKVFGGYIMKRDFKQTGRYSMVTLSGPGYNGILAKRILIPPATQEFDVYTNVRADDLMKRIVRRHLGDLAPAARQVPAFTVDVEHSASSVVANYNGRYETVIDALKSIAKQATDTRFLVMKAPNGTLQFRTYVPIIGVEHGIGTPDTVLFDTAGGNVLDVEYVEDGTSLSNYIIGGGTGDGASRLIREGFNTQSIDDWGRLEEFLDTSAKTSPELDVEILKKLDEVSRAGPSLSFTVGRAGRYEFPVDFQFGDRVSAIWKEAGLTLTDVISGITMTLEENEGFQIEMSVGQPNLFRLAPGRAIARFIRAMRGEVGLMQRH